MTFMHAEGGAVSGPPPSFKEFRVDDAFHTPQLGDALDHVRENCARGLPFLKLRPENNGRTLCIVGGGPSLTDTFSQVRDRAHRGDCDIIAINDTYDWLAERGVVARYFAMMEIDRWPVQFLRMANRLTTYYLADIAHPSGFDRLQDGFDVRVWHPWIGKDETRASREIWADADPDGPVVLGGEAIAVRAINLGWALGFRDFEMYGVDGCYRDGESHVYFDRRVNPDEVWYAGRAFRAPYYLARQANDLRRFCLNCHALFNLRCFGDGLVQHVHRTGWPDQYERTADAC